MPARAASLALLATSLSALVAASPVRFPDVQTSNNPSHVVRRALMKRDNTSVGCGLWATANWSDVGKGLGEDTSDDLTIAAQSCGRIGCYDTSGVYICNDQDVDIAIPMSEAVEQKDFLKDICLEHGQGEGYYAVSGQVFSDNYGGYNLNIGFCNTNDPNDSKPSDYIFPGPEGNPDTTCGGNSGVPCEGASCIEGTIVMDSQESIRCSDFLGPTYVGAGTTATYSTTRTIGTTWTVGGFLSIDTSDLAPVSVQAGFFSSFAETTTTGSISGISADCGDGSDGDYTCAMHISPQCWAQTGTCQTEKLGTVPWANIMPQLDSEDGQSVYFPNICLCPNCDDTESPGAPEDICPMDCASCNPNV